MKDLNLLIVEDDQDAINNYQRAIGAFNTERTISYNSDLRIIGTPTDNKNDAITALRNSENNFDAAIVDLDLLGQGRQDSSGNDIIREIKNNLRFPVFVITGTPQNIDDDLKDESSLFKVLTRGDEGDYLEQIAEIYHTGITNILNRKGVIETYISSIFWKHLSNSLDLWINDSTRTPEEKEKSLLRHTISHMHEYIDEGIEKYHPSEFYITAPIKENISTGDVVIYQDNRYLVLTPSCDIIKRSNGIRSATKILFCRILPLEDVIDNYPTLSSETGLNNSLRKKLNSCIENKKQNYHFTPKSNSIDAGLIDFQDKLTINSTDVDEKIANEEMVRIATVSMPFLKDIISRYSNYFSRQGSPDFDVSEVYNSLF